MLVGFDSLRNLPLVEKLHVVEVLWEDIAESDEQFPMPPWLRGEVENRIAAADPAESLTREEVWRRAEELRG
jgi:hypothetical protein